ncbi:MAG TPA: sigma-70 family RNA polymerase sigma factor [Chloroflexota bacterium]
MSFALAHDGSLAIHATTADHDRQLSSLMTEYERPLYNFVLTIVRDADVAMDCVQDTFLRAYESLRKGKIINTAWLYTVARHRAIDEFRRKRWIHPDAQVLEHVPVRHTTDESVAVQSALEQLPRMDREVLHLFVIAGFKTDEIGDILGMNGTAIRQRLYRARERFRAVYGPAE